MSHYFFLFICSTSGEYLFHFKNSIKNTEMLEKYIYCITIKKNNKKCSLNANLLLFLEFKICELSIQPRDFPLKYTNRTENLIGGKIKTWEKLEKL